MNPPMGYPAPRSSTPRTLGLLSIIFGSIVAAISLFGLVAGSSVGSMMQTTASQKVHFERYMEEVHTVSLVQSGIMFVMSMALIYIGTGQRKYQRWAASASVKWGVVALLWLVVNLVLQFVVVLPALDRFMESISHGGLSSMPMSGLMKFGAFIGLGMYAPFPIILIVAFRKPHNLRAMEPEVPTATVVRS